jgi:hypothetical protein
VSNFPLCFVDAFSPADLERNHERVRAEREDLYVSYRRGMRMSVTKTGKRKSTVTEVFGMLSLDRICTQKLHHSMVAGSCPSTRPQQTPCSRCCSEPPPS